MYSLLAKPLHLQSSFQQSKGIELVILCEEQQELSAYTFNACHGCSVYVGHEAFLRAVVVLMEYCLNLPIVWKMCKKYGHF